MKLGDIIQLDVSNIIISITEDGPKKVSQRELAGLQYIGGHIVHTLHNCFRSHKNWRGIECSKLLVLLEITGQLSLVKIRN